MNDPWREPCPHCEDGHGTPERCAWGVYVGPERDGDNQPVRLYVQPTAGAHVAWEDALWLWRLIRERGPEADRPLDLGPDGLPRLREAWLLDHGHIGGTPHRTERA